MKENLFEEFHRKKEQLKSLATKAFENSWIDENRKNEIIDNLDKDILTIGVIGQMKCGKSTFLNSFVFEDDVLPAATTPMTAALTLITYGPEKKLKAEFYTKDEWLAQKEMSTRSLDEVKGNPLLESKVKAAKELVGKSKYLGDSLSSYLGKSQEDSLNNLEDYVGADGKFISITKAVTIYYPKEYLKGVEIVDTPGFNDPIVSREERTKEFLKRAHVVLLMLYAGRPFDSTDRSILFKNVGQCGTGKVLIGINKYDIPYENGETEEEIIDYVKKELRKACAEESDQALAEIVEQVEPITLSAEMALLSELPMSKISSSETYDFAFKRHCDNFEVSSQPELREKSHIDRLINSVKVMIEKEKDNILSAKPINAILAAGRKKKDSIQSSIRICQLTIKDCSSSDEELEVKRKNYERATKKLNRKIEGLGFDLEKQFKKIVKQSTIILEDDIDNACSKLDRLVDEIGKTESFKKIESRWNSTINTLITKTLKRHVVDIQETAHSQISKVTEEFIGDAEEILYKYVDRDFDVDSFIKEVNRAIEFDVSDKDLFSVGSDSDDDTGLFYSICIWIYKLQNMISLGGLGRLLNVFNHNDEIRELHKAVEKLRTQTDVERYLTSINGCKDVIITSVTDSFLNQCLTPIQEKLDEVINDVQGREIRLANATEELNKLKIELEKIEVQIEEIQKII